MRYPAFILCLIISACGHTQNTLRTETAGTFILGDSAVTLLVHRSGLSGPLYYSMHDDENTSVDAAKETVQESGGTLYELVHTGRRFIGFNFDSTYYVIDPNRIYTDAGVWREIRRVAVRDSLTEALEIQARDTTALFLQRDSLFAAGDTLLFDILSNQDCSIGIYAVVDNGMLTIRLPVPPIQFMSSDTVVFRLVRNFADTLLSIMQLDRQELVIALHNNTNNGYSLESYLIDNIYQNEAIATYRGTHPDPDDFYFVTERRIYEALQPNNYHIILQDNEKMTDDGSLSVYCGLRGIHYVNVEAQHKHEQEQKEMLELLLERIVRK